MLTTWYLAILHHLGWAVGTSALPAVTAGFMAISVTGQVRGIAPDFARASRAESSRFNNSARVARVSAPSLGAGCFAAPGVAESFTGGPVIRVPSDSGNISLAAACGSFNTSSRLRTGEQGMPYSAKSLHHSALVRVLRISVMIGSSTRRIFTRRGLVA